MIWELKINRLVRVKAQGTLQVSKHLLCAGNCAKRSVPDFKKIKTFGQSVIYFSYQISHFCLPITFIDIHKKLTHNHISCYHVKWNLHSNTEEEIKANVNTVLHPYIFLICSCQAILVDVLWLTALAVEHLPGPQFLKHSKRMTLVGCDNREMEWKSTAVLGASLQRPEFDPQNPY